MTLAQSCDDLLFVLFTITPTTLDRSGVDATLSRELQSASARFITDHDYYLSIRYSSVANSVAERQHV